MKIFFKALLGLLVSLALFVFLSIQLFHWIIPDVTTMHKCIRTSMYQVDLCSKGGNYVRLDQISPHLQNVIIASEDADFYGHRGFDWHEIQQSMQENLEAGKNKRGASTITQQLAKNVFLSKEKSYWRKVKEAYLTYQIEKNFTKKEILEKYLNVIEFGPNIYGVKAAAEYYFKKSPANLNVLEASFLAFLLPNPKSYSTSFKKGQLTPYAKQRMQVLLKRLLVFRKIDEASYHSSMANLENFPWQNIVSSPALTGSDAPLTQEQIDKIEEQESKIESDPSIEPPSFEEENPEITPEEEL